jgi:Mrp family chromosome partitioning ATPase
MSPDPLRWLLATLLAGLFAGAILALLAEHFDDRLTGADALARASGTSLVVMLPRRSTRAEQQPNPYELAQANLAARHPNAHRIMIAPATKGDRAEALAVQYGLAAAHAGHRVVVVQADAPADALPRPLSPNGTALTTIPLAAPSDPRLVSRAFTNGEGQFDIAVLSVRSPQVSPTAVLMARTADIAILVATSGVTTATDARRAADSLRQAGVEVAASMLVAKGGAAEWNGAEGPH